MRINFVMDNLQSDVYGSVTPSDLINCNKYRQNPVTFTGFCLLHNRINNSIFISCLKTRFSYY